MVVLSDKINISRPLFVFGIIDHFKLRRFSVEQHVVQVLDIIRRIVICKHLIIRVIRRTVHVCLFIVFVQVCEHFVHGVNFAEREVAHIHIHATLCHVRIIVVHKEHDWLARDGKIEENAGIVRNQHVHSIQKAVTVHVIREFYNVLITFDRHFVFYKRMQVHVHDLLIRQRAVQFVGVHHSRKDVSRPILFFSKVECLFIELPGVLVAAVFLKVRGVHIEDHFVE